MRHRVGLVGAGGSGTKRAAAVIACDRSQLVKVCDLNRREALSTAIQADADVVDSWEDVVNDNSIDRNTFTELNPNRRSFRRPC